MRALRTGGQGVAVGIDETEIVRLRVDQDPLALFDRWFRQAGTRGSTSTRP
jgi:hypothetical protein